MANETIARYELQSELGRGGMATVYLAYDPNFRRNVAIKRVAGNLQTQQMYRERFAREAQLIAKIEHPAIVPVYDYGEYEHDLYLVMRYMPGGSLASRIKNGILPLREAAQILSQIAPALDAVHAQGIIHRDLKPGNILFDNFGNPALSDFGIAHFTAATSDLTGSAVIGTPAYMSPEQVRSEKELDGRSDIYALGVILFEMLAGRGPFHATTPLSIAFKHLTDPIPSIRTLRPDLPVEVDRILSKSLAKERELRYATASEMARELQVVANSFEEGPIPQMVQEAAGGETVTEVDTGETSIAGPVSNSLPPRSIASSVLQAPPRQRPSRKFLAVAAAGLALFLILVCGSLGVFGTWAGLRSLLPGQSPTITVTAAIPQATSTLQTVLFADDFSDPQSGWPAGQSAQGTYTYQPDGYHILVQGLDQVLWASTERVHDHVSVSVDATSLTAEPNGYYGLLCRIQDEQNFYYFVVQNNGSYTMGKYKNGEFGSFFPDGWRQSAAVHRGSQTNRLQADCTGTTLRLSVNNTTLAEVTDPDFNTGFSGILAATLGDHNFEVRFNNFLVVEAKP